MASTSSITYSSLDWIFLGLGVTFILIALTLGPRWQSINPIDFNSEKVGSAKIPFAPLLVLVGVLFAGVGVFFRWTEVKKEAVDGAGLQRKIEDLTQELERFKSYDMNVQLDFHESIDPSKLHTDLLVMKPGRPAPRQIDQGSLLSTLSSNVLLATVPNLGPGDSLYFVAREAKNGSLPARTWRSEQLQIPVAQLSMTLQP